MATISQSQLQEIFSRADTTGKKLDRAQIVQELVNRGNIIEGLNEPPKLKSKETRMQALASSMEDDGDITGKLAGGLVRASEYVASPLAAASGFIQKSLGINGTDAQELPQKTEMARTSLPLTVGLATAPLSLPASATAVGLAGATGRGMREASDAITGKDEQSIGGRVLDSAVEGGITGAFDLGAGLAFKGLGLIAPKFAGGLKENAKNTILKALGATTKPLKKKAEKVAGGIMERPMGKTFAFTRAGLEAKAAAGKEVAGEAIDEFGKMKGHMPTSAVVDFLEAEKGQYMVQGKVVDADAVNQIGAVQDIFRQFGDTMDDEALRAVRKIFDNKTYGAKGKALDLAEGSKLDVMKTATDRIRRLIAGKDPDLAALNKEFTFWSSLEEVAKATNQRTAGQTGLMPGMAGIAGGATAAGLGIPLKAAGFWATAQAIRSTGWRLLSAKVKSKIADALVGNNMGELFKLLSEAAAQKSAQAFTEDNSSPTE